jgi:hypothetical protein
MSTIKSSSENLTLNADGAGNDVVIQSNGTNTATITAEGLLQYNSGYGSVTTAYGCRAWVNFDGTGTVTIRDSGNVSSITDAGVGSYFVNFTNAMPDANYSPVHSYTNETNVQHTIGFLTLFGTTYFGVQYYNAANSTQASDKSIVSVAVFR